MPNYLVNDFYPTAYWSVPKVTGVQAPHELWWSSRERRPMEDLLPTSEYLEIDFGRLRQINFLSFDIMKKPINVTVEYDALSFANGDHKWLPISRITDERFDNYIDFDPKSINPWLPAAFYFTNSLGDMISTRWLRIRFDRRINDTGSFVINPQILAAHHFGVDFDKFPWSIDVKNLRTARVVSNLDDTRGLLFDAQFSEMIVPNPPAISDADTAISVSVISGAEVPPAVGGLNDFPDGSV